MVAIRCVKMGDFGGFLWVIHSWCSISNTRRMENARQKPSQNSFKSNEITQLTQGKKVLLFYCPSYVFWTLSLKKENNSGGKFGYKWPLESSANDAPFQLFELAACGSSFSFWQISLNAFKLLLQICKITYRVLQCSVLRLHIKRVRDFQIVCCLQNRRTNYLVQRVREFVNKPFTSVSNP